MKFACPHCQQHLEADDTFLGTTVDCPTCGKPFVVEEALIIEPPPPQVPDSTPPSPPVTDPMPETSGQPEAMPPPPTDSPKAKKTENQETKEQVLAWATIAKAKALAIALWLKRKTVATWKSGPKGKAVCIGAVVVLGIALTMAGKREPRAGTAKTITLPGGATMEMVWCPPGTFMMGSPEEEEGRNSGETLHQVTLTKGFWMAKYEVTRRQWNSVMEHDSSPFAGDELPMQLFSHDAQNFCEKTGLQLPTEAQWEYACHAGTSGDFYTGENVTAWENEDPKLANYARYRWNGGYPDGVTSVNYAWTAAEGGPAHVGSYEPNNWGLYDMLGNMLEWCLDSYTGGTLGSAPSVDPRGGADCASDTLRMMKGGAWNTDMRQCRTTFRGAANPGNFAGCRLCLTLE